jgi:hypothetical protein
MLNLIHKSASDRGLRCARADYGIYTVGKNDDNRLKTALCILLCLALRSTTASRRRGSVHLLHLACARRRWSLVSALVQHRGGFSGYLACHDKPRKNFKN